MSPRPHPASQPAPDSDSKTTEHVRGAIRGDQHSLAWIIERFSPVLLVHAEYRLGKVIGSNVTAEDVVQETWLRTMPKLGSIRARDGRYTPSLLKLLAAKACGLATNYIRKYLLTQRREGVPLEPKSADGESVEGSFEDSVRSVFGQVAAKEDATRVRNALATLDELSRETVVMRGIEGLSNQEIADELGEKPNTVAQRYKRALTKLRECAPQSIFDEFEEA